MKGAIVQTAAERFAHGSRSRYVKGCRCTPCRESNRVYYHQRQAVARERLAELQAREKDADAVLGPAPVSPAPQLWTAPDGSQQVRLYARACPGLDGPCPTGSHLRKDSKGNLCRGCRERLAYNGVVSAERARAHLLELSAAGVGRRAVAAACDVASSMLMEVRSGRQLQIRADTERRILAVDAGAVADSAVVPARETWRAVRELCRLGMSKAAISGAIGNNGLALQIGRRHVLARTAMAIRQLLEREKRRLDERERAHATVAAALKNCPRCGQSHKGDATALAWCLENLHIPVELLEVG